MRAIEMRPKEQSTWQWEVTVDGVVVGCADKVQAQDLYDELIQDDSGRKADIVYKGFMAGRNGNRE